MLKDHSPSDLHLRLFVEIAKDESLTKAAERLNISQPALSQHLHQLEEALGQRLMERHGRGLRLTDAGKELEHQLHGVFHHIDVSVARFRETVGKISGTIRIAGVHNLNLYFLPEIIKGFCDSHPNVHVRMLGRSSTEVAKLIGEGHADVGLFYGTDVADERLAIIHLFNETMVVACLPDSVVASEMRSNGVLPNGTCIVAFARSCSVRSMIEREFPAGHVVVKAEVEALDTMLSLASVGVGACILPSGVPEKLLNTYGLQRFLLNESRLKRPVTLTFRKEVEQSPLVHTLLTSIRAAAKLREQRTVLSANMPPAVSAVLRTTRDASYS